MEKAKPETAPSAARTGVREKPSTDHPSQRPICLSLFFCSLLWTLSAAAQTSFTQLLEQPLAEKWPMGSRGVSFGDYNNDGWPDLFLSENWGTRLSLWQNEGGRFTDRLAAIKGEIPSGAKGGGAIFGDYDNDGDLDLYIPNGLGVRTDRNVLLRNDGNAFRDASSAAGLTDALPTDNAIWLDYDRDGYLDLYTGEVTLSWNRLYRNNGDGTFADVTEEVGLKVPMVDAPEILLGSNGGISAGDLDNDGWPDLYIGVFRYANRLFLSDGQGRFQDATTGEIADPGEALGTAVGDIDNDGDLDIFQAAGGSSELRFRSLLLLNLGEGQFLDVLEPLGLATLGNLNLKGPALGDIDNDGDLDLLTGNPSLLFLNNGDGIFVEQTAPFGIPTTSSQLSLGDIDNDGDLDVTSGSYLYRNNGNDNHYLRVELVGRESNRSGSGARLIATSGSAQQMREISGGTGWVQHQSVAHFGLGQRTTVDRLEIRWPSGRVDLLTEIPADQQIRILEGQTQYHPIRSTTWESDLPSSVTDGAALRIKATVQPGLFETGAAILQVTADLSDLGGSPAVPLTAGGEGLYELNTELKVATSSGWKELRIDIEQETSLGLYRTVLVREIQVLPAVWPTADRPLYSDAATGTWQVSDPEGLQLNEQESTIVHEGNSALSVEGRREFPSTDPWAFSFHPAKPVDSGGYRTLRFAFHPGDVTSWGYGAAWIYVNGNSARLELLHSPFGSRLLGGINKWLPVEIPLEVFHLEGPIEAIHFAGELQGTFYLDDIRLIPADPPPTSTAVLDERTAPQPSSSLLHQNYPNPFNSDTVIRFSLPQSQKVELALFNLAGQQVATLVREMRRAGEYAVHWDGQSDEGVNLASGIYLYRLRLEDQKQTTRKLLLLR